MNIFKPSFEDYLTNIMNEKNHSVVESILFEMPLKPVGFQDTSGEYGEKHHVISGGLPIFMDWYDIYYLYQFPEKLWVEALSLRYTKILYEAKKNENYQDIQNVTLHNHGSTYVFKDRNTFGTQLVDKIERTVDTDHFMTAKDKTPEGRKSYEDKFKANKDAKIDMGGYMGMDMSGIIKTDATGDLWTSKGMMGPNSDNIRQLVTAWVKSSSHGLLGDTEEYGNTYQTFSPTGGRAAKRDLLVLNVPKLKEISRKMSAAGAVPFVILANGSVFYKDVDVPNGTGSILKVRAGLPVLLPGKALDAESNKKYESLHTQEKRLSKVDLKSIKDVESYKKQIEELRKEMQLAKSPYEKEQAEDKINNLLVHVSFDDFVKEKNIDPKSINDDDLKDLKIEFTRKLYSQYKELGKKAKTYDNYDWNFHRFNVDRHPHDPLETGLDNPFELGDHKYGNLENKTAQKQFGIYNANNQSKSMIHGEEGDWEKYFKDIFSPSSAGGDQSFNAKFALSNKEAQEVQKEAEKYLRAIGRKLASNSEVISYLGINSSNAQSVLSSFSLLKNVLAQKGVLNNLNDGSVPKMLQEGFKELKNVSEKLNMLEEEMQTGFSKSDIQLGVEAYLKRPHTSTSTVLKIVLDENKHWIIFNAENFVKRNLGESIFIKFKKILQNPQSFSALEKHKTLLGVKQEVRNLASNYAGSVSQLEFVGIPTRRKRAGKDNRSTTSITSSDGERDDMDFGVIDDKDTRDNATDDAIDRGETLSPDTASQYAHSQFGDQRISGEWKEDDIDSFISSFFGEAGKSSERKLRPKSDSTTHRIGHNISTMHDLMQKEAERAAERARNNLQISAKQLELKNKASVTHQEMQMLRGINNSLELYNFLKAFHEKKKLPGDSLDWAKNRIKSIFKNNKMTASNSPEDIAVGMRYQPADQAEGEAVKLYQRMEIEAEDEQEISDKIVAMSKKVDSLPKPEFAKHVVDRLRILNKEPQIFDTYKMAASESDVVPNVDLKTKTKAAITRVGNKHASALGTQVASVPPSSTGQSKTPLTDALRAKVAAAQQAQQQVSQPQATPVPQQQNPTASEPPRSMSLADRMRTRKEQK